MAILQLPTALVGQVGINPVTKKMVVTNTLTELTTAGFLNAANLQGYSVDENDVLQVIYGADPATQVGTLVVCTVSISGGVITLVTDIGEGNVVLPTIANHIATYVGTDGKITEDPAIAITGGSLQAGLSGTAGKLIAYPATAASGHLEIVTSDNTNSAIGTIQMDSLALSMTAHISQPVVTPNVYLLAGALAPISLYTETYSFSISVDATSLAAGGLVTLVPSGGSAQFIIISLNISSAGINFSGGGGNRLLSITDNTSTWSVIPAATLQALANAVWGSTELPLPVSVGTSTPSGAGVPIKAKYSGGTTDYSAGEIVISGTALRVA